MDIRGVGSSGFSEKRDPASAFVHGQTVRGTVVSSSGKEAVVRFGQGTMQVMTDVPLREGESFRAQVDRSEDGWTRLRIVERGSAGDRLAAELSKLGLPADPRHVKLAQILLSQTGSLNSLVDVAIATAGLPEQDLEAALFLLARKLPLDPSALSLLRGREGSAGERLMALIQKAPPELQALLRALTIDKDPAEALRRLARLLTSPEAWLARDPAAAKELGDLDPEIARELRAQQLENAARRHDSEERFITLPLAGSSGNGELRVHYRREGRQSPDSPDPAGFRATLLLDMEHLHRIRIDVLMAKQQVNCQVVVEDPEIAELVSGHLPALKQALSGLGVTVNAMDCRVAERASATAKPGSKQVDLFL